MKNILVKFDMTIGDYEHSDQYIFDKKMTEYQYCKKFWNLRKKNSNGLKPNVFWDDFEMNAIKVYSEKEINKQQAKTLKELGIVY
tara:strand:+ start:264 stop:518 length:255 start_codon:yes stop_codon:yes gene_type:complete